MINLVATLMLQLPHHGMHAHVHMRMKKRGFTCCIPQRTGDHMRDLQRVHTAEQPYEVAFITPLAMLLLGTKAEMLEKRKHGAPPRSGYSRRLAVNAYPAHPGAAAQQARWHAASDGVLVGGRNCVPTTSMLVRARKDAALHSGVRVGVGVTVDDGVGDAD